MVHIPIISQLFPRISFHFQIREINAQIETLTQLIGQE